MSVAAEPQPVAADSAVVADPSVKRVLVFRLGSLGDTMVALPSFHLIAQAFPHAERRLLTNVPVTARAPAAAAVLGGSGLVHSYESYPVGTRNPFALLRLLARLRRYRPDVAVYLKAETSEALVQRDRRFLRLAGAKRVVGADAIEDTCPRQAADGSWEPEADRLLRSIRALGAVDPSSAGAWDLRLEASEVRHAAEVTLPLQPNPFMAVSIGTKVQAKHWGRENWSALLTGLARQYPGRGLLLAGAPEEAEESQSAAAAWTSVPGAGPVVNACGRLTPRQSAAAFQGAKVFIGHDSGPMHLAAAVNVPVVAIFAARNRPRTWFPYGAAPSCVLYHQVDCWGCGLETCLEQRKKCILSITVPEVLAAVQDLVDTKGNVD